HRLELLAERPLVVRARADRGPVAGRMDRPRLEHRLLGRAPAVAVANAPRLGVVLAARIELDPIPAVPLLELERGRHQVLRRGLAVVEVAPERNRRPVHALAPERG